MFFQMNVFFFSLNFDYLLVFVSMFGKAVTSPCISGMVLCRWCPVAPLSPELAVPIMSPSWVRCAFQCT